MVGEDDGGFRFFLRADVDAEPVELGLFEAAVATDGLDRAEAGH